MCGRFDQNKIRQEGKEAIEAFLAQSPFMNKWNIPVGAQAYLITNTPQGYQYTPAQFGLTPAWAEKKMYLFNARSEGKLNPDNRTDYRGELGIFSMPAFRKAIQHRAVLYITAFYEGPEKEKLKKPFRLASAQCPYLYLAAITEQYVDKTTGDVTDTFSIITQAAVTPVAAIGHHRSPVFLQPESISAWLNAQTGKQALESILSTRWYPPDLTATPVDPQRIKQTNSPEPVA